MVEQGGAALAIAQIRALANGAARKAVENGGKKALEAESSRKRSPRLAEDDARGRREDGPRIGAGFGALFDTAQMKRILDFADLFYHKRFIIEKDQRARASLLWKGDPSRRRQRTPRRWKKSPWCPTHNRGSTP